MVIVVWYSSISCNKNN